jgi:predicted PurR-regulated permease PerM
MEFTEKDVRRFMVVFLVLALGVFTFLLVKPIFISIVAGLILAYLFSPVYNFILRFIKEKSTTAAIVSVIALLVIFIPLWFIVPVMINQTFQIFTSAQNFNVQGFIQSVFPSASDQFIIQTTTSIKSAISKTSSSVLNSLVEQSFNNLSSILLHLFLIGLVFFFALRDGDKLGNFMNSISPLNKSQEKIMVNHFREITDSIIYGNIIVGVIQGIFAGIGFLIFDVPNALVLTIVAIIFGIIPVLGPIIVWAPVSLFFFTSGNVTSGVLFILYNLVLVSGFENILRPYIVSRRSNVPTIIIFIGMIGGTLLFGVMGLILGPLILAYFLEILKMYKERALSSLFVD